MVTTSHLMRPLRRRHLLMRRQVRAVAMVASLLALVACEQAPTAPSRTPEAATPTAPATETTTPTIAQESAVPTPSESAGAATLESAAAAYVELADQTNERGEALVQRLRNATTLEEARAVWAELATVEEEFIAGLDSIEFPEGVNQEVRAVRDMERALVSLMQRVAAAADDDAYRALVDEYVQGQPERRATTNALRAALGLPPLATATPAPR